MGSRQIRLWGAGTGQGGAETEPGGAEGLVRNQGDLATSRGTWPRVGDWPVAWELGHEWGTGQ
jgi:hypothetical protein